MHSGNNAGGAVSCKFNKLNEIGVSVTNNKMFIWDATCTNKITTINKGVFNDIDFSPTTVDIRLIGSNNDRSGYSYV